MGIEKKEVEIDGHTYELTQFGALQGRRVLLRLFKLLGPAMGSIATAVAGSKDVEAALATALGALADSATEADLDAICDAFAGQTKLIEFANTTEGTRKIPTALAPVFDSHFANRYPAMFRWVAACVSFNYSSFLVEKGTGLKDLLGTLRAPSA